MALGALSGGCALGLPISPLMFLIKDQPPALRETTPATPQPAPNAPTAAPQDGDKPADAA